MSLLIFRLGSIGDTAVAIPSLRLIHKNFKHDKKIMLTNFPVADTGKECPLSQIIDGSGLIDQYIEYPSGKIGLFGMLRLMAQVRRVSASTLVYLMPTRTFPQLLRDWLFFKACGIRRIIGLDFSENSQTRLYDPLLDYWEHEAQRLARLIQPLGKVDLNNPEAWNLGLTPLEREEANQQTADLEDRPFFAMSIGTKVDAKDWGEPNWIALSKRLTAAHPQTGLVLIGSYDEHERCQRVAELWRGPALNLCGKLQPRVSAAVLEKAQVFIGHDSGPMHLAAAVSTPVIAIFSARNKPGEWFPWGSQHRVLYNKTACFGCRLDVCVEQGKKCIRAITVESVVEAAHQILTSSTHTAP